MLSKIVEHQVFVYLADHGAELDYIIGTFFNSLTASFKTNISVLELSEDATLAIAVVWNYLDALYDFMLAAKQWYDTRTYRHMQSKTQAILNIVSGVQLLSFSYNPLLTEQLGLKNNAALATTSFAFSALFDFFVAGLEFYNTKKEMEFKGWLKEKIKQLLHTIKQGHDHTELLKDMHARASEHAQQNADRQQKLTQMFNQTLPVDHPSRQHLINRLNEHSGEHSERSRMIQLQLKQAHKDSRTNLCLKAASFLGMTLLAVVSFLDANEDNPAIALVLGLGLTTYVAAAYLTYNGERFMNLLGNCSYRLFARNNHLPVQSDIALALGTH